MNNKDVGRRRLAGVTSTTLHETLKLVRLIRNAGEPRTIFGVSALDALIPPRPAVDVELLEASAQDLTDDQVTELIIKQLKHRSYTLIELTATESCSGKSTLVRQIIANAVLPASIGGNKVGGKDGLVVLIDTDDRLDIMSLRDTICSTLVAAIDAQGMLSKPREIHKHQVEDAVQSSLARIHVLQPKSFDELLDTLEALPGSLLRRGINHAVEAIVVDSASAFYWQQRAKQDLRRLRALDGQDEHGRLDTRGILGHALLRLRLAELSERFECPIIATTWDSAELGGHRSGGGLNNSLPAVPDVRLVVQRQPLQALPPAVSVERALMQSATTRTDHHEFRITNGTDATVFQIREATIHMVEGDNE